MVTRTSCLQELRGDLLDHRANIWRWYCLNVRFMIIDNKVFHTFIFFLKKIIDLIVAQSIYRKDVEITLGIFLDLSWSTTIFSVNNQFKYLYRTNIFLVILP